MISPHRGVFRTCQTSKMKCFAKIVNGWKPLTIFAKRSILDTYQGSEYASATSNFKTIWKVWHNKNGTVPC